MDDLITTTRVTIVARRLLSGETGTTREIAGWVGLTRFGAWEMLWKMSLAMPLTFIDGRWQIINQDRIDLIAGDLVYRDKGD